MATQKLDLPTPKRADDSESEKLHSVSTVRDRSYSRNFDPKKQIWSLFRAHAARMILTCVLIALMIGTLKAFAAYGNIGESGHKCFNWIVTALVLLLALNFFEAFKDMAKVLRWRILAYREFSIREADLILGCENLKNILLVMWESRKKPLTVFVCTVWIALNILAQIWIATIGLAYSLDLGKDSSGIFTKPGNVSVANLDCYYEGDTCATGGAQGLAHTYGENIRAQKICPYTVDSDIQGAPQDCYYFESNSGREFAVRYAEYSPKDLVRAYPYFTDRIVKASAGECFQYSIDEEASFNMDSSDGKQDVRVLQYFNSTFNGKISVPKCDGALDSTTYIYNGVDPPQNGTSQLCGTRCLWLYAWQNKGSFTKRPMFLFQCPISISEVSNITPHRDWQILPDMNARLAAASIALTGRYTNTNGSREKSWQQYQLYLWDSYWETQNLTTVTVGARMSEFAIGSLAVMAHVNPQIFREGNFPIPGYQLSVRWNELIYLFPGVVAIHFILVVLMLWIARLVVVPDDSILCTAHVLQGLAGPLKRTGSLLHAKELAEAIGSQGTGQVVYGIRDMVEQVEGRVLGLGENIKTRKKGERFPSGLYI